MTKLLVEKSQNLYDKQVDAGRSKMEYEVGQKGLLNVNNFTLLESLTSKFMSKIGFPFSIVEQMSKDWYKLELPFEIKVHPTFHVSLLKPFKEDTLWPNCKKGIGQPPKFVGGHLEYMIEGIFKCRKSK